MLLTVKEMQDRAAHYSYRKGWTINVREGCFEGPHLEIIALLEDSIDLGKMTEFQVHSPIPPQLSIEQFDLFILWRLARIESHECREWFKCDGKALFYPHVEDADTDDYSVLRKFYEQFKK